MSLEFDEQGVEAAPSRRDAESCAYRGLSDAAFSSDDEDAR